MSQQSENPAGGEASAPGADGEGFGGGELVLLVDRKNRSYLRRLEPGGFFHSHSGLVAWDDLLGRPEGSEVRSIGGTRFQAFRPTLSDFVVKMKRGAQVIYPKDLGPMLLLADIAPGHRVLESGVGSGALSLALLRAGAEVFGYEIRGDFARRARKNVQEFLGTDALSRYHISERDCYDGIDVEDLDRVALDLPEPWRVVPHAAGRLRPGGLLIAYTPSVLQATQLRESLERGPWALAATVEVLQRSWHIAGEAVRPDHRMIAHTGFLTHARRLPT
ncbi:MAG: tRNA (adenine-N1)-methyltransferase [bacterium]|nr:tRNA (adenine-N1)-methyltransferase [bacterium]MXV90079.1 tRNA (adenine-N1)-methyltransferase [Acidimicrobiia bacterium]MYC46491.1 tRNA (adenine-N1)-methyltransferase [Acidimicrobiia bacterium]MYI20483.1 tRNA (adenine-N1)-methyltransferase [Acidimicrobiia bacterium]